MKKGEITLIIFDYLKYDESNLKVIDYNVYY